MFRTSQKMYAFLGSNAGFTWYIFGPSVVKLTHLMLSIKWSLAFVSWSVVKKKKDFLTMLMESWACSKLTNCINETRERRKCKSYIKKKMWSLTNDRMVVFLFPMLGDRSTSCTMFCFSKDGLVFKNLYKNKNMIIDQKLLL